MDSRNGQKMPPYYYWLTLYYRKYQNHYKKILGETLFFELSRPKVSIETSRDLQAYKQQKTFEFDTHNNKKFKKIQSVLKL